MNSKELLNFIQKYHLKGRINTAIWEMDGKQLIVSFFDELERTLLGTVTMKSFTEIPSVEKLAVLKTTQLKSAIAMMSSDISLSIKSIAGVSGERKRDMSLIISDDKSTVNYVLGDCRVISRPPPVEEPATWDICLTLDRDFIIRFIKAQSVLKDNLTVTLVYNSGKVDVILGYSAINKTNIIIDCDASYTGDTAFSPISFSAPVLSEILEANKDSDNSKLNINLDGLAKATFGNELFDSIYFLAEMG